ncbi:pollen receptor-like kinase 2 [Zingiber officinale]|uniref:pollen receptor-like kinase 2 n=1 Tax=Zingiber officinale TaxID=94328 RepID=UPI001C4C499D|nr:pollen receptor-like kinase 2 [Zingiber officinale]
MGARRRSNTVLVSTINDVDQGSVNVTLRTPPTSYEKSKSLDYEGSMVASADDEGSILLQFKSKLSSDRLGGPLADWGPTNGAGPGPCAANWTGVRCKRGRVSTLQLENMGLSGDVSLEALAGLPDLRSLSISNNNFRGPIPNLSALPELKFAYLWMNRFSGEVPDGMFAAMRGLKRLWLSQNNFSGRIPSSLTAPRKLSQLRLDGNHFDGPIPELWQPDLNFVNVSYNNLQGPIPVRLSAMKAAWFAGNPDLCGAPLSEECPKPSKKKLSSGLLIAVILIAVAAILVLVGLVSFFLRRRKKPTETVAATTTISNQLQTNKTATIKHLEADRMELGLVEYHHRPAEPTGKLSFLVEGREDFELEDLLRASAEALGNGNLGSSYKAILLSGQTVIVKRFKEMNAMGKEEFEEHLRTLGRLSHPNLLPLLAYCYRKEDKMLITNYNPSGSLAQMLHGSHGPSRVSPLNWPLRLKIIKGVARGLAHLYEELPTLIVPHGHLKSSNVLLNPQCEPLLTDYALMPMLNRALAAEAMEGYKAPECAGQHGKPCRKSDVWSLGILILEILTGKFPASHLKQGRAGTDLARWVNSVVREEWTGEVFDTSMKGTKNCEGEMLKLLQVGMACCEVDVGKRLELEVAMARIENLKEKESDAENSSIISDAEAYSSKAMTTEDEISFSINN